MEKIVSEIVKEIKELPKGTQFTVAELLLKYGISEDEKMFEYYKQIYSQISNIVKTPESQAFVGLPFNIPLEKCK